MHMSLLRIFTVTAFTLGSLASQTVQASLVALQPLVLQQVGGQQITHPAGPLTNANLTLASSFVSVDLSPTPLGWQFESELHCGFSSSPQTAYLASSDLEWNLSAPVPTRVTLRVYSYCVDDSGGTIFFAVPGHGSFIHACGTSIGQRRVDHYVLDLTPTPLPIRITQIAGGYPAGSCLVRADIDVWSPLVTPSAAGCGVTLLHGASGSLTYYQTDHHLDLVNTSGPPNSGTLRADGLGQWASFAASLASPQLPTQLPAPFAQTCPLLGSIDVLVPSIGSGSQSVPTHWELLLPVLPVGLTLYVQHASAYVASPAFAPSTRWSTSNVLRVDT
tara:strand:- start:14196 stop:15191 length:996 start_codon:yes stop_codon:yes gene_type:complete